MRLLPIGTKVYIKRGAVGNMNTVYSSSYDTLTSIKAHSNDSVYPYILDVSKQSWSEDSLLLASALQNFLKDLQPFESTTIDGFGQVLRLPNGYVFSNQVTFVPLTSNSLQD